MIEKVDVISVVNLLKIITEKKDNWIDLPHNFSEKLIKDIILDFCHFGNRYNLVRDISRFAEILNKIRVNDFSILHDDFLFFKQHSSVNKESHFSYGISDKIVLDFLKKYEIKQKETYKRGIFTIHKGFKK